MKKYIAEIVLNGEVQSIKFETDEKPVEWLWGRYGMSTFISSVEEVEEG